MNSRYMSESTTHRVFGSPSSLVVGGGVVVEGHDTFSPVELDHHEGEKVGIVLGAWQVVVGFNEGVGGVVGAGEEVAHLLGGVVVDVAEGFHFRQPLHVLGVVGQPDCGVEGHFVVLGREGGTI